MGSPYPKHSRRKKARAERAFDVRICDAIALRTDYSLDPRLREDDAAANQSRKRSWADCVT